MKIDPDFDYSAAEAAELLQVTADTVKEYCRTGQLVGKRLGPKKRWHIRGSALIKKRKEWGFDDNRT
jgi:hypothetical protein